ncbi:MAG: hypothetical protein KC501_41210 [Myxococcales bacterium]|nr:hypothetical protein [Myxococcales bacterium]
MNTLVPVHAPIPVPSKAQAPPVDDHQQAQQGEAQSDPQAAMWSALGSLAKAATTAAANNRGGPLLAAVVASVLTSGLLWGLHMATGDRAIITRLEQLEQRQQTVDDHNAWVVDALVALSEDRPLPPPRVRRP